MKVSSVKDVPSRRLHTVVGLLLVLAICASLLASIHRTSSRDAARRPLDPSKLNNPAQLSGELNVWSWNIAAKSLKSISPAYQERYPHIGVNVEMSGTRVQTRFLLALSAGAGAPDVMQLETHEAPRFIATGQIADLTAVAARYEKDFPAASWSSCVRDGRVYAIPWDVGPCAVFYKPEIFARYDIDPDSIETWDDFIAAGQKILRKSGGRTKMLPLAASQLQMTYEIMLQQLGGQVFDEHGRIAINSNESERVLELIRRLLDSGICANVTMWSHEWMAGFGADTIATYPAPVWVGGTIKDTAGEYGRSESGWRVFPLPAFEAGGLRASNQGGSVLLIPNQCTQKEAAWTFIEFALCTRAAQLAQYANYDLFPAYLPVLDDPFFQQPDLFYGGQRVRALFAAGVKDVPVLHRTPDWVEANTYADQSFSRWAAERQPTGPVLETLAGKLHRRLNRPIAPEAQ